MKIVERSTVQKQQTKDQNLHGGPSQGQQELRSMSLSRAIFNMPN